MLKKIIIAITAFSLVFPCPVVYAEEETTEYVSPFQNPYLDGWTLREISEQNKIDNLQEIAQVVSPATINEYCNNLIRGFYSQYIVGSAHTLADFTNFLVSEGIYDAIELKDGFFVLTDPDFIKERARDFFYAQGFEQPVSNIGYWLPFQPNMHSEHGSFKYVSTYMTETNNSSLYVCYVQLNGRYQWLFATLDDTPFTVSYKNAYSPNDTIQGWTKSSGNYGEGSNYTQTGIDVKYNTGDFLVTGYYTSISQALSALRDTGASIEPVFKGNLYFNENPSAPLPIPVRNVYYTDYEKNIDDKYHKLVSTSPTKNDFIEPTPKEYTTNYPKPVAYYIPREDKIEDPSVSEFDFVAPEINNSLFGELVIPDFFVMIISLLCIFLVIRCIM